MKELTNGEEQLMHILWKLKKGFVKDLIDKIPEPKPAYNTVSTFIRIMEKRGLQVIPPMVKPTSIIR